MNTTILYRVSSEHGIGLWYNSDGIETNFYQSIENGQSAHLPMPYSHDFKDGGNWVSSCDSFEGIKSWFSFSDIMQLKTNGFQFHEYTVTDARMSNGHHIFLPERVVSRKQLDMDVLK